MTCDTPTTDLPAAGTPPRGADVHCLEGDGAKAAIGRLSEADGWSDDFWLKVWNYVRDGRRRRHATLPAPPGLTKSHADQIRERLAIYERDGEREHGWFV